MFANETLITERFTNLSYFVTNPTMKVFITQFKIVDLYNIHRLDSRVQYTLDNGVEFTFGQLF